MPRSSCRRVGRGRGRDRGGLAAGRRAAACRASIFVNKMDRENANYDAVLDSLKAEVRSQDRAGLSADRCRRRASGLRRRDRAARERLRGRHAEGGADPRRDAGRRAGTARRAGRGGRRGERRADDEVPRRRGAERCRDRGGDAQGHARGQRGAGLRRLGAEEHRRARADQHDRQARPLAGRGRRSAPTADGKELESGPRRPVRCAGLQDDRGPVRRQADLLPRRLRHAPLQGHVWNASRREEERVGKLLGDAGQGAGATCRRSAPGDIARGGKADHHQTGDTLAADREHAGRAAALEFPTPSLQVAIEPESEGRPRQAGPGAPPACSRRSPRVRVHREAGHRRDDPDRPWATRTSTSWSSA